MQLNRRQFLGAVGAATATAATLPALTPAYAQAAAPVADKDFRVVNPVQPTDTGAKIEVIEFFWYACPHCFAFEPTIEAWIARLPADVHFRRIPVGFDALKETHQRIFYTWEALGLVDQMHLKTFTRFHVQKRPIDTERAMLDFAQESGLDVAKVGQAWNSFSVQARCREARRLEDDYGIEHMPEMAIAGRFVAVAQPDAGPASVLVTTDWLVNRVRRGG